LPAVTLERAKLTLLDAGSSMGFFNQRTDRDLGQMNIEPNHVLVESY
jgi:hypothetical protein